VSTGPSAISPLHYLRHRAYYRGLIGGRPLWRAVALVVSPVRFFRNTFLRQGLRTSNQLFFVLAGALWLLPNIRRAMSRSSEFVALERLQPGQVIQIRALERPSRRR
jgi:hypothetical protein